MARPVCIERWLAGRRSIGEPLALAEAVSVYASFARQYGAEWAIARIMSGRFRVEALPASDRLGIPTVVWWPSAAEGAAPGNSAGRAPVRFDTLDGAGPLALLDRPVEIEARLRAELFEPVWLQP